MLNSGAKSGGADAGTSKSMCWLIDANPQWLMGSRVDANIEVWGSDTRFCVFACACIRVDVCVSV